MFAVADSTPGWGRVGAMASAALMPLAMVARRVASECRMDVGELVALLRPRMHLHLGAQREELGHELRVVGVQVVEYHEHFLGLASFREAVVHDLLTAGHVCAGEGVDDFLLGRFVDGEQAYQAMEGVL